MRTVTITVRPEDGFHPANDALAAEPSIRRVAIHHIQLFENNTVVLLYQLRGDLERAERLLSAHPSVISCEIRGETDGVAFIHSRPTELSRSLIGFVSEHELAVETPIKHASDGRIRVTVIGDQSAIQRALSSLPDEVTIAVERIEQYQNSPPESRPLLTDRQREIAELAVREGYYEVPRETTQQHLAERLGISTGTLSEHLRKIEQRTFEHVYGYSNNCNDSHTDRRSVWRSGVH